MNDKTTPPNGGKQASPLTGEPPGVFSRRKAGNEIIAKGGGGQNPDKMTPPEGVSQDPEKTASPENDIERILLLKRFDVALERAEKMKGYAESLVTEGSFEMIIEKLALFKGQLLENPNNSDEALRIYDEKITEANTTLDGIEENVAILASKYGEEADKLEEELEQVKKGQAEQFEKIKMLLPLTTKYNVLETSVERIRSSSATAVPNKDEIISSFEELRWVADLSHLENATTQKSTIEIKQAGELLQELTARVRDAMTLLDQEEAEKKLQSERITKIKKGVTRFEALTTEADGLSVADDVKATLLEKEAAVKNAKDTFDTKLSSDSFDAFFVTLNEYRELIEATKKSLKTFTPPSFLSGSTQPTPDSIPDVATVDTPDTPFTSGPRNAQPWDDFDPLTQKDTQVKGLTGDWEKGYQIKIGTRNIPIKNKKLAGTILRYKALSEKLDNKGVDFTKAESLKEGILSAMRSDDFALAGEHARALGGVLNSIVEERLTPSQETRNLLDRSNRIVNNPTYKGEDFSVVISLNEQIQQAIGDGDPRLAASKNNELKKALDAIETKKPVVQAAPKVQLAAPANPVQTQDRQEPDPESIRFPGVVRRNGDSLQIKIGNEFRDIPRKVTGVVNAYRRVFRDSDKQGIDFAQATVYKDAILNNVARGEFDTALKNAQTLSTFLAALENPVDEPKDQAKSLQPSAQQVQAPKSQELIKNTAVGEIISILTKSRFTDKEIKKREASGETDEQALFNELAQWEKNWLQSGKIDAFREANGNIPIREEQIQSTKKLLHLYLEIFKDNSGLGSDLTRTAEQSIILYVKILAGIQDSVRSDIKHLVDHYVQAQDDALFQKITDQINTRKAGVARPVVDPQAVIQQKNIEQNTSAVNLLRGNALRPTVSGPSLSLEMAKRNFEIQKTAFLNASGVLEKMLPYLQSDLEKTAFARMKAELEKEQTEIETNPTKEAIAIFSAKVERYITELSKKVKFVTKLYGAGVLDQTTSATIPADSIVMRNKRLRGNEPKEENVDFWQARQDMNLWLKNMQTGVKAKSSSELSTTHKEMFARDPVLYKHVYGTENPVRDAKTEAVISKTMQGKPVQSPKELLEDLTKERDFLELLWKKLHDDIAKGVAFGNPEGEKKVLHARIELLNERIQKYTKLVLDEVTHPTHNVTGLSAKQMYSPQEDPSLNDPTRGEYVQNEKGNIVPLDTTTLTEAEVRNLGKESGELRNSVHPNHTSGMVSSLNQKEAQGIQDANFQPEKPYRTDTLENAQALYNKDEQVLREKMEAVEVAPDNQKERHYTVNKLANWLSGYPTTKKFKWGALAAGILTLGLSSGAAMATTPKTENKGRTLADFMKERPSLEKVIGKYVPERFAQDFMGPREKSFDDLIKVNAPSFAISDANPAPKDKIAKLLCKDVYDIEGAGAGLTEEQQGEIALIIKNLQGAIKGIREEGGTLYDKDVRFFGDMTIRQLYDKTKEIVAAAKAERDKLNRI